MKKIYVLLASLVMMVAMLVSGCGSSDAKPTATNNGVSADVKAIQDRGVLKVGVKVDVPKFGFKDPKTDKIEGLKLI